MQRKNAPPQISEEDRACVDGSRDRRQRREGVLDLEDTTPAGAQGSAEDPAPKPKRASEDSRGEQPQRPEPRQSRGEALEERSLREIREEQERESRRDRRALLGQQGGGIAKGSEKESR